MKLKKVTPKVLFAALGLMIGSTLLTSCGKDNNSPAPVPAIANLALYHASPGSPELTFRINGSANQLKDFTYSKFLPYVNIQEGNYEFSFTKKDATDVLSKLSTSIKKDKFYTLHVTDVTSKQTIVVTEDDLTAPAADKAKIRFVNLSPDAGALDVTISGKTDPLFKNAAFKSASTFAAADPGAEVTFQVTETTKTTVLAKVEKVKIEKGKIYTIYANGLKAATDATKLSVNVVTNK
ncbi:DUF4397 domain-containing protein [Mucilaginibacter conchicola]|uniref:DUF4397 domain-containing protein n=1 Tax=Mucilaginibacter conchicola TaxID=2303333 RepID=A0A372NMS0_9SPHI|nr:DUF4397 domain-containing protein [Mucilaginibacter conchicola]RFZ90252.1 DUF4397 domain-containing protein [Mucilaginibacter conchicola]